MAKLWGEDKILLEEAFPGAVIAAAGTLSLMAPFLGTVETTNILSGHFGAGEFLVMAATGVAAAVGFAVMGWQQREWHYKGMEYVDHPILGKLALQRVERVNMLKTQMTGEAPGLVIGGVEFSRNRELSHFLVEGVSGSGKTVIINWMLYQQNKRGGRCILHDPRGDFVPWFFDGLDSVMLGPWDARAVMWDISEDIRTAEDAATVSEFFIGKGDGQNKYFNDAAIAILTGFFAYLLRKYQNQWCFDTITDVTGKGADELIRLAHLGNPTLKLILSNATGKAAESVISTLAVGIEWFLTYRAAFEINRDPETGELDRSNMFSIRRWIEKSAHQNVKKVILNNNITYARRAEQIFGAIMSVAANQMNSATTPAITVPGAKGEEDMLVCFDEFLQSGDGAIKALQVIEELGRSRGFFVVKAFQDSSQNTAKFGRDKGAVQTSLQQTKILCKLLPETASHYSQIYGQREVIRLESALVDGQGNGKRAVHDKKNVVNADELMGLRVFKDESLPPEKRGIECFVQIDNVAAKLFQPFIPREYVPKNNEPVIESERWARGLIELAEIAERIAELTESTDLSMPVTPISGAQSVPVLSSDASTDLESFEDTDFEETDWDEEASSLAAEIESDRQDILAQFGAAIQRIDEQLEKLTDDDED